MREYRTDARPASMILCEQQASLRVHDRRSSDPDPVALRVLAEVAQPPRLYQRQDLRSFTDFTPLNHLDDAVPPESETARKFDEIAMRIASRKATSEDWRQAEQLLELWRDNDARL